MRQLYTIRVGQLTYGDRMKLVREWNGEQAKKVRIARNQNQTVFWSIVFVGQSGGARYESGRRIPPSVQALMGIAFGTDLQSQATINGLRNG